MSVTNGRFRTPEATRALFEASAAFRCASSATKIAVRYCEPLSQNWPYAFVGSTLCQKTSRSFSYVTFFGSYTTSIDSRCPVPPAETSWYVGFAFSPPVYPTVVETTPKRSSYGLCMHQKQPPAKAAFTSPAGAGAVATIGSSARAKTCLLYTSPSPRD